MSIARSAGSHDSPTFTSMLRPQLLTLALSISDTSISCVGMSSISTLKPGCVLKNVDAVWRSIDLAKLNDARRRGS